MRLDVEERIVGGLEIRDVEAQFVEEGDGVVADDGLVLDDDDTGSVVQVAWCVHAKGSGQRTGLFPPWVNSAVRAPGPADGIAWHRSPGMGERGSRNHSSSPRMSRLDSFIRRLTAQRAVLDHLCGMIEGRDGPVLELGLGNGRTYDHLRERLPSRRIVAFDRALVAHRGSVPASGDLILGEIAQTAAGFAGAGAVLVHADIETGYPDVDAGTALWLARLTPGLLDGGGLVASGLALDHPALERLPLPPEVPQDRYFIYRRIPD